MSFGASWDAEFFEAELKAKTMIKAITAMPPTAPPTIRPMGRPLFFFLEGFWGMVFLRHQWIF